MFLVLFYAIMLGIQGFCIYKMIKLLTDTDQMMEEHRREMIIKKLDHVQRWGKWNRK